MGKLWFYSSFVLHTVYSPYSIMIADCSHVEILGGLIEHYVTFVISSFGFRIKTPTILMDSILNIRINLYNAHFIREWTVIYVNCNIDFQ